ncbi:MAG TPA: UDP-N-acetylmuramate dehydrogenase [Candidatus Binatus sp.]|nr:UDP-N-acetylmuramate dehydrogenase [Candidatus Binatus sp.]
MAIPEALVRSLSSLLGERVRVGEPLARHTSLRIGGPADLLALPDTPDELGGLLRAAKTHGVRVTLLGGGSNLLVADGGIPGIVVKLGRGFAHLSWKERAGGCEVRAGAAVRFGRLARAAVARGLSGLEYAEGIPGTVGGALFMNAGAYGGEVAAAVAAVDGVTAEGELLALAGDALAFCYRRAELAPGFVVTAVRFRLQRDGAAVVRERMEDARSRRTAAQPHGQANAGSIFKNPPGDHAGRLIEVAGLKGARAGRARISERHANFIVNEGGACAVDVKALMDLAQRVVWEQSGVWLEPEVRLLGSW